ncbi:MAG: helical backbone metal receptor [Brumimicrobium sp.]
MKYTDQYGTTIELKRTPQRIVSLVPSQTELLYHLGLKEEVIGITKFCIYPEEWYQSKTRIGGPKKLKIDKIKSLNPDLIIGNKEENIREEIEEIQKIAPVWLSDIYNLTDAIEMINSISLICNKQSEGNLIVRLIESQFSEIKPLKTTKKVLYMIWKNPFMVVGPNTFIHHILTEHLGFENIIKLPRYPEINPDLFQNVDYVFLSTEPYPFNEKHIPEVKKYFPQAKIMIVDGEYFTWYGSRLASSPGYFTRLLEEM